MSDKSRNGWAEVAAFVRGNFLKLMVVAIITLSGWIYGLFKQSIASEFIYKARETFITKEEHPKLVEQVAGEYVRRDIYNIEIGYIKGQLESLNKKMDTLLQNQNRGVLR